jgi:hypothetical protein
MAKSANALEAHYEHSHATLERNGNYATTIINNMEAESLRRDVECCFGILKGRWRILKVGVRLHGAPVRTAGQSVNLLVDRGEDYEDLLCFAQHAAAERWS